MKNSNIKQNITELNFIVNNCGENGRIFTVDFYKKNGKLRKMNCRFGVSKYLKGGINATAHIEKYVNVFDLKAQGYRKINLETIKRIAGRGFVYNF